MKTLYNNYCQKATLKTKKHVLFKSKQIFVLRKILNNKYFPFITAAVAIISYYLAWDLFTMYFIALATVACMLFLDDLTPVIGILLFSNCIISKTNSPSSSVGGSNFYFTPAVYTQIIILVALIVSAITYRVIKSIKSGAFKITPTFLGCGALSLAFTLNGVLTPQYTASNLLFGVALSLIYTGVFALVYGNVKINSQTYIKISFAFLALAVTLVIEECVLYLTTPNIIFDGAIIKDKIVFGWGIWNTLGMLLSCCLPFVLYLAAKLKHGYILTLFSLIIAVCVFLTSSRQSILATAIIYPISFIILIVKGKYRFVNVCIAVLSIILGYLVMAFYKEKVIQILNSMLQSLTNAEGEFTGNGRTLLIELAFDQFKNNPLFGGGFFAEVDAPNFDGLGIIPEMYHNSPVQMLGACGLLGLFAYLVHRAQTIIIYFRRPTVERTYIALSLLALIITSLFDNHLFYIFPTFFYVALIAILAKGENRS